MIICITLIAAIVIAAWSFPHLFQKWTLLSLQNRCLNYTAPPDRIAFDTRALSQYARSDPDYHMVNRPEMSFVGYAPKLCYQFQFMRSGSYIVPDAFPAFLHRRKSPAGNERLVQVMIRARTSKVIIGSTSIFLNSDVIQPGSILSPPIDCKWVSTASTLILTNKQTWPRDFVMDSGQPDPADASHFTIRFSLDGSPQIVDGWLKDDDSVTLELRRTAPKP